MKFFHPDEFLPPINMYTRLSDKRKFQMIDSRTLYFAEWIRGYFNKPVTINDWMYGGDFTGRGLRLTAFNEDYNFTSQHSFGRAIDFDVEDIPAEEVRQIIKNTWNGPFNITLEDEVTWVHVDVRTQDNLINTFKRR